MCVLIFVYDGAKVTNNSHSAIVLSLFFIPERSLANLPLKD